MRRGKSSFRGGQANQPDDHADGVALGRAFAVGGGGFDSGYLPEAVGRRVPPAAGFCGGEAEAILGYLKKTAANATHDYFKHGRSQTSGGDHFHVSTDDVDPKGGKQGMAAQKKLSLVCFFRKLMGICLAA